LLFLSLFTSIGSTFGIKSIKKRYFRLEGGELRYYEDEDIRPSKLKDTLDLKQAKVLLENSTFLTLSLHNGRNMRLEAPSPKLALEWKDALTETISLLQFQKVIHGEFKKSRRFNIHERRSEEEKEKIVQESKSTGGKKQQQPQQQQQSNGANSGSRGSLSPQTSTSISALSRLSLSPSSSGTGKSLSLSLFLSHCVVSYLSLSLYLSISLSLSLFLSLSLSLSLPQPL
jgi:hypothetical protein